MSEANSSAGEHERGDQTADENVDISSPAREAEAAENPGEEALAAAEARANENWDKYLRAAAELDNVRKRAARDVENARKYGIERFVSELLAVSDSMEAALASGEATDAAALLEGNRATLKLLGSVLTKFGVEEVDPVGEPFDPQHHEAMTMVPHPDAEPNTVIDVIQKGYVLNGRLVRPARVVVAAAPPSA